MTPPRPSGRRLASAVLAILAAAGFAWVVWPRPALELRVAPGGRATVTDRLGRTRPLGDTVRVGGGGRRRVRVVNADTMAHQLGLFAAPAGETVSYTLPRPGTYTALCTAHGVSPALTLVVR